jgi:hypothetical protein
MKPLVIIDTFPSSKEAYEILNNSIDSFVSMGYDVMLVSHIHIEQTTTKKCKYVIYDQNNKFLSRKHCPLFYNIFSNIYFEIAYAGHALPICRNIKSSVALAKAFGYEYFIFTESDVIIKGKDCELFESYVYQMVNQKKSMMFFKPKDFKSPSGEDVYESLLFAGNVDYFQKTFKAPINEEEWLKVPMQVTLEQSFFNVFHRDERKFLIVPDHSSKIFTQSDINLMRIGLFNCEMIHNEVNPNKPVLVIMNYLLEDNTKFIDVYVNGNLSSTQTLIRSQFWFYDFEMDNSILHINVYNDESKTSLYLSKQFILNDELLNTVNDIGTFKYINQ